MHQALIFDFDGVILDSEPLHFDSTQKTIAKMDLAIELEEYLEHYTGLSDREMFHKMMTRKNQAITDTLITNIIAQKTEQYQTLISNAETLPTVKGLKTYLQAATSKFNKIAICSGAREIDVLEPLKKLDRQGHIQLSTFETIVTRDDVNKGKPSPEGYLLTAKRLNMLPENCLVIEDSPHGITAAKTAGMSVIALTTTFQPEKLQYADQIVSDYTALMTL